LYEKIANKNSGDLSAKKMAEANTAITEDLPKRIREIVKVIEPPYTDLDKLMNMDEAIVFFQKNTTQDMFDKANSGLLSPISNTILNNARHGLLLIESQLSLMTI
jgi:hypothetical protein